MLHTALDWLDARFVHLRELIACHRLFDDMRALASYGYFSSWSALIEFMILSLTTGRQPLPAGP